MSYNKIENKKPLQPLKSTIKIIGNFSQPNKNPPQSAQIYQSIDFGPQSHVYCPQLEAKPENYIPMGKKIYVQANLIAIIDTLDNLWFISDLFPTQLNISAMLSRKVKNIFLSENQCIISNKKNPILLNWGAKKIIDVSNFENVRLNQKISKNISNYFQSYVLQNSHKDDKFLYSNIKKIDNSNKLYQLRTQVVSEQDFKNSKKSKSQIRMKNSHLNEINQEVYSIFAFPTQENIFMKNKVVGISVGRVHIMCWDTSGNLFSWGNRSIALGYQQLPHEKFIKKPKLVRKLNKFITMAYAATHYSLALSSEGNVYEWGIKEDQNQINEQLIFEPKILKFNSKIQKIIMLKGRQDQIACLNTKHQLYLWGKKAAKLLPEQVRAEFKLKSNDIYEPFLIPHLQTDNVIDFGIGEQFIAVLTSNSFSRMMGEEQQAYWNETLIKIRSKLKLSNNIKTQARETKQNYFNAARNSSQDLSQIAPIKFAISSNQLLSNVDKSYRQRNLKKEYFSSLKNEDKFYINLLRDKKNYQLQTVPFTSSLLERKQKQVYSLSSRYQESKSKKILYQTMRTPTTPGQTTFKSKDCFSVEENKIKSKTNKFSKIIRNQKQNNKENTKQHELQMELHKILREKFSTADGRRKQRMKCKRTNIESYEARLERVRLKKETIQQDFNEKISKKVQENSIQYRMHRHQLIMQAKIHEKNKNLLKQTLQNYLIKHYLIRMLISPIQEARRIKIEQFAKSLHLSRIEKNLRRIFVRARVTHGIKKLKKLNFIRFAILCHVFKVYIKYRRQKKAKLMRKIIAEQLYKNVLKEKIRFGLSKTHLNTRKLQKFREWLVLTKIQRIKCLKILWKHHLLSVMKISNDADAISLIKSQDNCTFQSLYRQKITANPMLKLETFLNKSPIFDLKTQYFQSIIFLFRRDQKIKSQKIMKCTKKKIRIKFSGEGQTPLNTNIHNTNDLLPYSLHYNLVIRPKSMQINIPENMKRSEKWIQQEKNIFERNLRQILEIHQKNLVKTRRKYDIDLAYFIRQKYQSLAEKRWKYILEYNHIKVTPYKNKRLKQLYRIFDLIGMQKILNQDCFPEKYLMLDQAIKKRDAPTPPNPFVVFGINEFKQFFKKYYETISIRAKQIRKNFV